MTLSHHIFEQAVQPAVSCSVPAIPSDANARGAELGSAQTVLVAMWKRALLPVLLALALLWLYGSSLLEVAARWQSDEYAAHGVFLPPMALLLLWWKRGEIAAAPKRPCAWGLLPFIGGMALQLLAWRLWFLVFALVSLVPTLWGLVLLLWGRRAARLAWFPLLLVGLATPLPRWIVTPLSVPLQTVSAKAACALTRSVGVPLREENFEVRMPRARVQIVESCSGFKKSVALVVFAAFYASLFAIPAWRQGLLVLLALPIALCANILRVTVMLLAGAWWGQDAVQWVHDGSELAVLCLCFVLLLWTGRTLGCTKMRFGAVALPVPETSAEAGAESALRLRFGALALLLIVAAGVCHARLPRLAAITPRLVALDALPRRLGEWRNGADGSLPASMQEAMPDARILSRTYQDAKGGRTELLLLSSRSEQDFHAPQYCLSAQNWEIATSARLQIGTLDATELQIESGARQAIMLYWYEHGQTPTAWDRQAARWMSERAPTRLFARILVPIDSTPDAARQTARRFAQNAQPALQSLVVKALAAPETAVATPAPRPGS